MTKSELIDRLAAQFPQLVAKDAELAVKMILDAMAESLAKGERIEIRGFGSFGLNYRPPRTGRNPEVGREGAGAGEARAALQGRQGIARTRRFQGHQEGVDDELDRAASSSDNAAFSFCGLDAHELSFAGSSWRRRASSRLLLRFAAERGAGHAARSITGLAWQAPLIFVLLVVFALGVAAGLLAGVVALSAPEAAAETALRREHAAGAAPDARRRPVDVAAIGTRRLTASWTSSSGGCCRSRRCSSRSAGSPRASTSSICCANRARCRCRISAASISC